MSPTTYVMVHGAWFGGWVWKPVADRLRRKGHRVFAPTLAGLGGKRYPHGGVTLTTHVDDISGLIAGHDLRRVVLVGWSYGGMVVTDVLARMTERIAAVIYLDAFVPSRGSAVVDYAGPAVTAFRAARAAGRDAAPTPVGRFGPIPEPIAAAIAARLRPQPIETLFEPSRALVERPRHIAHTYVHCTGFAPSPFGQFYGSLAGDPAVRRLRLHTSHVAMLTAPAQTQSILEEAAATALPDSRPCRARSDR